jgi:hypothetical protein
VANQVGLVCTLVVQSVVEVQYQYGTSSEDIEMFHLGFKNNISTVEKVCIMNGLWLEVLLSVCLTISS